MGVQRFKEKIQLPQEVAAEIFQRVVFGEITSLPENLKQLVVRNEMDKTPRTTFETWIEQNNIEIL